MMFRTSQIVDEYPFLLLARAKVPTDDQCIRTLAYRFTAIIHTYYPAPDEAVNDKQVIPFTSADGRNGFLPQQLAICRIMGGNELSSLHNDSIVHGKQRLRRGLLRSSSP